MKGIVWLLALTTAIMSMFLIDCAQSVPCVAQTGFFGPRTSTNYTELYVDDDDTTQIIKMKYCVQWEEKKKLWQHFRGFEATVQSATGTFLQTYGTLDPSNPDNKCEEFDIDEEIMFIEIYSDKNDVEGLVFYGD